MERAEERDLIRKAARGDREAAGALIRGHQPSLYAYLLRMSGRPDVAEDTVQEAFVRALTHLDRFDERYRFSTWLFTIARRLYVNACQKLKPAYDTDIVSSRSGHWVGPDDEVASADAFSHTKVDLQEALMTLSSEQREVIVLFHQLDWPIALIAQHMCMPEGTVKSHLHRGRRKLRAELEGSVSSRGHVSAALGEHVIAEPRYDDEWNGTNTSTGDYRA
jgi:RNA polymerase sigma-70 factor, ECF subfamily